MYMGPQSPPQRRPKAQGGRKSATGGKSSRANGFANGASSSAALLEALYHSMSQGVAVFDQQLRYLRVNPAMASLNGLPVEDHPGRSLREVVPTVGERLAEIVEKVFESGQPVVGSEFLGLPRDNPEETPTLSLSAFPLFDDLGQAKHVGLVLTDVTDQKRSKILHTRQQDLAHLVFQSVADSVICIDPQGKLTSINRSAEELCGWSSEQVRGLAAASIFHLVSEEGVPFYLTKLLSELGEHADARRTFSATLFSRHGIEVPVEGSLAHLLDEKGQVVGAVATLLNVSVQKAIQSKLHHQAAHDPLTGLVNRAEFEAHIRNSIQTNTLRTRHTLLFIDIDNFKVVNDTCGHAAGDRLLTHLAELLQMVIRSSDTLARLGGDEFGMLLRHCDLGHAVTVANKVLEALRAFRFQYDGHLFVLTASIGVVGIEPDDQDYATLLRNADSACYAAKDRGGNRSVVYQPFDHDLDVRHREIAWVSRINQAFERDLFVLFFQAIHPVANPDLPPKAEVLIRIWDEKGGYISPGEFLPAAERYNLAQSIDEWVIDTVLFELKLKTAHLKHSHFEQINVNISGNSLNDETIIPFIRGKLAEYGVTPSLLCFELTESVAVTHHSKAVRFIDAMHELGCSVALDDFGIGTSSFAYLKSLPVDYLKIAGALVKDIVRDPVSRAMVEAVHRVAQVMEIKTVAEYVENAAVFQALREIGVHYGQGYEFHKPEPWQTRDPSIRKLA